ncbi:hypothetical protein [Romboutsia ilealis]|uniref:hypothetical protein n=1 Tax=Romboutsia ilealis TaxID=1115758 RepID=UPI002714774C|nr:hypothetical protein [Romboutsia ilealis]
MSQALHRVLIWAVQNKGGYKKNIGGYLKYMGVQKGPIEYITINMSVNRAKTLIITPNYLILKRYTYLNSV